MQEAIFAWVAYVIAELWPFDFAKMRLAIDFRKLNSWSVCKNLVRGVFRKYLDKAKIVQISLDTYLYFISTCAEYQS